MLMSEDISDKDLKINKLFLERIKKDQDKSERLKSPKFIEEIIQILNEKNRQVKYEIEDIEIEYRS